MRSRGPASQLCSCVQRRAGTAERRDVITLRPAVLIEYAPSEAQKSELFTVYGSCYQWFKTGPCTETYRTGLPRGEGKQARCQLAARVPTRTHVRILRG
jgi:hypothetical protein